MKSFKIHGSLLLFCLAILCFAGSGCSRGSGCDNLKGSEVKLKKDGMPQKKARTALFDKKMRRKG